MGHAAAQTPDHGSIRIGLCQRRMLRCVFVCILEPEQKWKCLFLRLLNNHSYFSSLLIRIAQETHSRGGRFPRNLDCGPSPCLLLGEFCVCHSQATPKMATTTSQPLNLFISFESGMDRIGFKAGGAAAAAEIGLWEWSGSGGKDAPWVLCLFFTRLNKKWSQLPLNLSSFFFLLNPEWTELGYKQGGGAATPEIGFWECSGPRERTFLWLVSAN